MKKQSVTLMVCLPLLSSVLQATNRRTLPVRAQVDRTRRQRPTQAGPDGSAVSAVSQASLPAEARPGARPSQRLTTLCVQLDHADDLYAFPEESLDQQGPLVLDIKCGTVRLNPQQELRRATVNLYGPNARLVVTHPHNLDKSVVIRSLEDGSVLHFEGPSPQTVDSPALPSETSEPLVFESQILARKSLRLHVGPKEVVWTGECSGQADIQKEGPGRLSFQGQESQAHTWRSLEGRLTGSFRQDSRVNLQQRGIYEVTKDQTLASFSGSEGTTLLLEKACLTLNQDGQFSGCLSADDFSRVHVKKAWTVDAQENSSWPLIVDGTLTLKGQTPTLSELSGCGIIQAEVPVCLFNGKGKASTFEGTWKGMGGFMKKGPGHLHLTGSSSDCQGEFELNEGTLSLAPKARLGAGRWVLTGGTFCPTAEANLQGELLVKGGTIRVTAPLTLKGPLQLDDATFWVENGPLTLASSVSLGEQARVRKIGLSPLVLTGTLSAQGGTWMIQEGFLEDKALPSPTHKSVRVEVGPKGFYRPCQLQTLSGLAGQGVMELDSALELAFETPQTFQGNLVGTGSLSLRSGELSATSSSFSKDFTGSLHLASGTPLTSKSPWHLHSLTGGGVFSTQGAPLGLHLTDHLTFAGQLKDIGPVTLTSEGDHVFTLESPQKGIAWVLEKGVHLEARRALTENSLLCHGGSIELEEASDFNVLQGDAGSVTLAQDLVWRSSGKEGFAGDFLGHGALITEGDVTWALAGPSHFEGPLHIQKGLFSLGESVQLPSSMEIDLSSQGQLNLSSNQHLSSLTGRGKIGLDSHTLHLSPRQASVFSGDVLSTPEGRLEIESPESWTWSGGPKQFTGTLRGLEGAHLVFEDLEVIDFPLDLAEKMQVEFPTETLWKGTWTTQGTGTTLPRIQASAPLTFLGQAPLTLRGHLSTTSTFRVGGTLTWQEGEFSPLDLCLLEGASCQIQNGESLPSEVSVLLQKGSLLTLSADQTLKSLQGTGVLNMQGHALTLTPNGNILFEGSLQEASEFVLQGETTGSSIFWAHAFENVPNIVLNEASLVWTQAHEKPLETLVLQTPNSRLSLEADLCCRALEGQGAITCGEHGFTLQGGTSSFSGPLLDGTVHLTEGAKFQWCPQPQAPYPSLPLTSLQWESLGGELKAGRKIFEASSVELEKGTEMTLQGEALLKELHGKGSVHFESLVLRPKQSFSLEGELEGKVLRLEPSSISGAVISLAETLQATVQEILCHEGVFDVQKGCHVVSPLWAFSHSHIALHGQPSEEPSHWIFSGENSLASEALTLKQAITLRPQALLKLSNEETVTLEGSLQGSACLRKSGKGSLNLAGPLGLTGLLEVMDGEVNVLETATPTTRFDLQISELARVVSACDLDVHSLQGKGTVDLPQGHTLTLHVESDENVEANVQGGSFVLTSSQPAKVTLGQQTALPSLTVAESVKATLPQSSSLKGSTICVEGVLEALSETLRQLHLKGKMTCTESLFLGGEEAESFLSGHLVTPSLVVQGGVVHLLSALEAQTVTVQRGLLMSEDALGSVDDVCLESSGSLWGHGTLQHILWNGNLRPDLQKKESLGAGFLRVKETEILEGAHLELSLHDGACQPLMIQEKVSGLDSLRLTLRGQEEDLQRLTSTPCLLMTVPDHVKGIPLLEENEGLAALFKRPTDILQVTRIHNNVTLFANPFTKADLR